jgi:copper chaperone CopZ
MPGFPSPRRLAGSDEIGYHRTMTTVDVLYRYEQQPAESAMFAIGSLKEVYGIRRVEIDEKAKTLRVEYDATRLNRSSIAQLLRRGGISVLEEVSLVPPQLPVEAQNPALPVPPTK